MPDDVEITPEAKREVSSAIWNEFFYEFDGVTFNGSMARYVNLADADRIAEIALRAAAPLIAKQAHNRAVSAARNALVWMEEWPDDLPHCFEDVCEEDGLIGLAMYLDNGKCTASVSFEADGRIVYAVINPATGEGLAKGTTTNFQESFDAVAAAIRQAAEEA